MVRPISIKTSAPPFLMHYQPEHVGLHYQYPTPWNFPFTTLQRTYEQHLFVPSAIPVPIGGDHHSVLLFFLSDKDQRVCHFFLNPVGECEPSQIGDMIVWNGMKQNRLNVVSKPARACYLKPRRYDKQSMNSRKCANCSEANTFTAHVQQTKDVFQVCDNVSRAWFSLWTGISEYSLNTLRSRQKSVTPWPACPGAFKLTML